MKAIIDSRIASFELPAYHQGNFITISSEQLKGSWFILFFYPNDFSYVCPTELADMANLYLEFQTLGVEVYALSPDSCYAHKAWHETSPSVNKVQYPMVSDCMGRVARSLGMDKPEEGIIRSTFLVDPEGKVKLAEYYASSIGRDAEELLRKVKLVVEAQR